MNAAVLSQSSAAVPTLSRERVCQRTHYSHVKWSTFAQGDYTLRAQVTSDKASLLEKQKALTLAVARTINDIKLDAYASYNAAVSGGPAFGEKRVRKGVVCPVFFAPPSADKV